MWIKRFFQKYTGWLRAQKPLYVINNLLNFKALNRHKPIYKQYGVKKSVYNNIGSKDFKNLNGEAPWLDQENALENLHQHPHFQNFKKDTQDQIINFVENGFIVLKNFLSLEQVNEINAEMERLLEEGKTDFNYSGRKVMDAHQISQVIDKYFRDEDLQSLLHFLLGKKPIPFQTINFREGSEQRAHSDSIHMSSFPVGYLSAAWFALEKCHPDNGPLFYYPGSHRMPYVTTEDYDSGNTTWKLGKDSYKKYEEKIDSKINSGEWKKVYFYAEPGDVFIWHANLIHGGDPIRKEGATRKSMVAHYFFEEVVSYHEISQRPALITNY